jgi:hypothetical protein
MVKLDSLTKVCGNNNRINTNKTNRTDILTKGIANKITKNNLGLDKASILMAVSKDLLSQIKEMTNKVLQQLMSPI